MGKELFEYLRCPICKRELFYNNIKDNTDENILLECICVIKYSKKNGIMDMTYNLSKDDIKSSKTFSQEWNLFDYKIDDTFDISQKEYLNMFYEALKITSKNLENKSILDAGCGNGQRIYNIANNSNIKIAIGTDISSGAINASKIYKNKKLYYIKSNIITPPFKEYSFDIVWCTGVLHTVTDPKKAFSNLSRLVKRGGKLYIWVFNKPRNFLGYGIVRIISKLPFLIQKLFVPIYFSFHIHLFLSKKFASKKNIRKIIRTYWDSVFPNIKLYKKTQILEWFKENNFIKIYEYPNYGLGFGLCGTKK
jgi:ubiquinone/menaquinone biosynthesis C-methylase UbiE